jgi:hypothetical protein
MTKLPKPTQVEAPSAVEAAELLVATREDELAIIEGDIASAEADLPELAGSEDDAAFESASLGVERLRRKELRATKRLEAARAELATAEARDKQDRKSARYEAGKKAAEEVDRLTAEYGERAAALIETFRKIARHAEVINAANESCSHYAQRLDVRGLRIGERVVLVDASTEYGYLWCKGEPTPPPKYPSYVMFEGVLTLFDETNPAHVAALAAEKSKPAIAPVAQRTAPQPKYGERELPDGSRRFVAPPVEWPPRQNAN